MSKIMLKRNSIYIVIVLIALVMGVVPFESSVQASERGFKISDNQLETEIEKFIEERKEGTAGVALAVLREGDILHQTQYGYVDVENEKPVVEDSVFEWGSVTKVLTWISVMQLVEQGEIQLETDIRTYLPEGFLTKIRFEEPITMLHLMNHQAGFQETVFASEYENPEEVPSLEETLKMSEPPQVYPPGEVTAYSNYGTALAGFIVEEISGVPFYKYVNENIFDPLGMEKTSLQPGWFDNPWVQENRKEVMSYAYYVDSKEDYGDCTSHVALYPAGSCTGSFSDFVCFVAEFTKEETKFFQEKETMAEFLSASSWYVGTETSRVHHGLWKLDYSRPLLGHGGNTNGFSSAFWFDPETLTGVAVMTNEVGEQAYNYGILDLLYGQPNDSADTSEGTTNNSSGNTTEPRVNQEDISGIYYSKRSFKEGFSRIATYASALMPIKRTDIEGEYKIALLDFSISKIGDNAYRQDSRNGLAFNLYKIPGTNTLQSYTMDYEKMSIIEVGTCIALVLAALLIIVFGVVYLLRAIILKIKSSPFSKFQTTNLVAVVASMIVAGIFFYLWLFIQNYTYNHVRVVGIFLMVCMAVVVSNLIYQIVMCLKNENRRGDLVLAVFLSNSVLTALFFETYKFWV